LSLTAYNDWAGPDNVTTLQAKLRSLHYDVLACTDLDQLDALVMTYQPVLDQAWLDHEDWHKSARLNIAEKRRQIIAENEERKRYGL